jgi:nucleotide-binding universal stress UspA family protein
MDPSNQPDPRDQPDPPPGETGAPGPSVLVVGLDGSDGSTAALEWCCAVAARFDTEVVAVHALAPVVSYVPAPLEPAPILDATPERREAQAALERWCSRLRDAGIRHRSIVVDGTPADALMRVARAEPGSWIVVGRRGRGGFLGMLLGSVPHALSLHAPVPVVIVPAASDDPAA